MPRVGGAAGDAALLANGEGGLRAGLPPSKAWLYLLLALKLAQHTATLLVWCCRTLTQADVGTPLPLQFRLQVGVPTLLPAGGRRRATLQGRGTPAR